MRLMRRKEREITDPGEIISIISRAIVCRIAFANDNIPYIVPMNYGYSFDERPNLFFHCANEGKKLDMIRKNNFVCFEIDSDHAIYSGEKGCEWGMKYSSIVGFGRIFIITDQFEKRKCLDLIMEHYGGKGEYAYDEKTLCRTTILKLEISEMTCKRK